MTAICSITSGFSPLSHRLARGEKFTPSGVYVLSLKLSKQNKFISLQSPRNSGFANVKFHKETLFENLRGAAEKENLLGSRWIEI